jgi:cytoskeletal protein CcmA (bactofilin family)
MYKKETESRIPTEYSSRVGEQTTFSGNITGSEDILINGEMVGDIDIRASVHVGGSGHIKGTIKAINVMIEGRVEGTLKIEEKIELMSSANITANMECKQLAVADGAFFEGKVHMEGIGTK